MKVMSEENKKESFSQKLKKQFSLIGFIVLALTFVGEKVWDTFTAGADLQFQNKVEEYYDAPAFNSSVDARFEHNMTSPIVLSRVLQSPEITKFAEESVEKVEKTIVDRIISDDSAKVNFITYLGLQTGLRDEVVQEKFATMFQLFVDGDLITRSQAEDIMRRRIRANF